MNQDVVITIFRECLKTTCVISAPLLLGALLTGLIVSILQAATQIHEMTLVFVPKILIIALCLFILSPWISNILVTYTVNIFSSLPTYVR
ncbi:MAG: flagellar biosynthesis protein FliQ [Deltaproteobacteria bacterium]|nr:flagellar biosynthesis protein FliQ [Deltaproteobacteria bacterium]